MKNLSHLICKLAGHDTTYWELPNAVTSLRMGEATDVALERVLDMLKIKKHSDRCFRCGEKVSDNGGN